MRQRSETHNTACGWVPAAIVAVASIAASASATTIARYDASTGNPGSAAAVVNPTSVAGGAWTAFDPTLGGTDAQEGVISSGTPAWRNLDGTDGNNPGYVKTISASQFQQMYANGWDYSVNMRVIQNGQFSGWGISDTGNDPGWNLATRERASMGLSINAGNLQLLNNLGGSTAATDRRSWAFNAGPASAFHDIHYQGAAEGTEYRLFIDGTFRGTYDWTDGTSNTSNDDVITWQSGSAGGANLEGYWNRVDLSTPTAPRRQVLFDDFQSYATNASGPITDAGFTATWAQFGSSSGSTGSRIFDSGTGGAAMQSRGWVTAQASGIYTDVEAIGFSRYTLSMVLAAETGTTSSSADWQVRVLLGQTLGTAAVLLDETGTDFGGATGKADATNQQIFEFVTGAITLNDRLFIEIQRTGGTAFLFVDDVFLTVMVPTPAALSAGVGLMLAIGLRRRRRRTA